MDVESILNNSKEYSEVHRLSENQFNETMKQIVYALKERGYNPYEQLTGYVVKNNPAYITKHNGARDLIQTLDFERVKQFVAKMQQCNQ